MSDLGPPPDRLVPSPVGLHAELYEHAARTGVLHLQRCDACAAWQHPPRLRCARCASVEWSWVPVSGRGRVYTWTVTHQPIDPAFAGHVPYAVLVVELDEGPRVVGNLVGAAPAILALGLAVRVVLDRRSDTVALVDFSPVPEEDGPGLPGARPEPGPAAAPA